MIKFEHTEVIGWEHVIRGMRNPKNSWGRIDSVFDCADVYEYCDECSYHNSEGPTICKRDQTGEDFLLIGPNDHDLMMRLSTGGPVHAKYRRMIVVYVDITAPLYWWKEFDTYKVGTVANSCSTMHKIHAKEFTLEDFSYEHLLNEPRHRDWITSATVDEDIASPHKVWATPLDILKFTIEMLNAYRMNYLETNDKEDWWQMIQLLPSSYNQKRTIMLNYEVLSNIYKSRKNHKLDEWSGRDGFIQWIESLPYSETITNPERGFTSKETIEIGNELQKGLIDGINKLYNVSERYPVTHCDLCNIHDCGDSKFENCKKCKFFKYSKWANPDNLSEEDRKQIPPVDTNIAIGFLEGIDPTNTTGWKENLLPDEKKE